MSCSAFCARRAFLPATSAASIESDPVQARSGRVHAWSVRLATHAWVRSAHPGMRWLAIDPTNNQWCRARHVTMAYGRDSVDATRCAAHLRVPEHQNMKIQSINEAPGRETVKINIRYSAHFNTPKRPVFPASREVVSPP